MAIEYDDKRGPIAVTSLDTRRPHLVGFVLCRCGAWHVAVVDARADLTDLQCRACGQMGAELLPEKPGDVVYGGFDE